MSENPEGMADLATMSYETAMKELETVVGRLESGETTLDESLALFRRGMALSEFCAGKLAAIEKQITQLVEKADGQMAEKPFPGEPG